MLWRHYGDNTTTLGYQYTRKYIELVLYLKLNLIMFPRYISKSMLNERVNFKHKWIFWWKSIKVELKHIIRQNDNIDYLY